MLDSGTYHANNIVGLLQDRSCDFVGLQCTFGKDAVDLAEGGGLGAEMGGVGLSEFEDIIKHTIPHIFVRVVAEVIRPRSM